MGDEIGENVEKRKRSEFERGKKLRLPKGKIEPYRLWFEFLKLVQTRPATYIDKMLYDEWGDLQNLKFNDWWDSHSELFETKVVNRVLNNVAEFEAAKADSTVAVMQISLAGTKKSRLKDVNDVLAGILAASTNRGKNHSPARFEISAKGKIAYKPLRGMLKYLQLYQANGCDIEASSVAYFSWARDWNGKVRSKKWKRPLVYEPTFLPGLIEEISDRKQYIQSHGAKPKSNTRNYDDLRSQARRFLRKGEKILANVALGKFPGSF